MAKQITIIRSKDRILIIMVLVLFFTSSAMNVTALGQEENIPWVEAEELLHNLREEALLRVAERENLIPDELDVVNSAPASFTLSDKTAYDYKVLDRERMELYQVRLNEMGEEIPPGELEMAEDLKYYQRYGKFDLDLYEEIQRTPPTERVKASIWLMVPEEFNPPLGSLVDPPDPTADLSQDEVETYLNIVYQERSALNREVTDLFLERIEEMGLAGETEADELGPIIHGAWFPEDLRRIAELDEVDIIYGQKRGENFVSHAKKYIGAHIPRAPDNNKLPFYTGYGVKVGMLEINGTYIGIADDNYYFQLGPYRMSTTKEFLNPKWGYDMHATYVAGIIRGLDFNLLNVLKFCGNPHLDPLLLNHTGLSMGVRLWAESDDTFLDVFGYLKKATRIVTSGSQIINLSGGFRVKSQSEPSITSRYFDEVVCKYRRSVICAAGNLAYKNGSKTLTAGSDYVTDPAMGFNVIAVGNYTDRVWTHKNSGPAPPTGGPSLQSSWRDFDHSKNEKPTIYKDSSWRDPKSKHGDREKPEITAPGTLFAANLKKAPWVYGGAYSGTSFSAPVVTGACALLLEAHPALSTSPEALKAILMASAAENIHGASVPLLKSTEDARDGAGGILVSLAFGVLKNSCGGWGVESIPPKSWWRGPIGDVKMNLAGGDRVRVAIAWSTDPDCNMIKEITGWGTGYIDPWADKQNEKKLVKNLGKNYGSQPSEDFDLYVLDPNYQIITSSNSWDNTYEIVEFIPPVTGTYILRFQRARVGFRDVPVGYAWWQDQPILTLKDQDPPNSTELGPLDKVKPAPTPDGGGPQWPPDNSESWLDPEPSGSFSELGGKI